MKTRFKICNVLRIVLRIGSAFTESFATAPSKLFLFLNHKEMIAGKKFGANEEVYAETEVYFEVKA